MNNNIKKQFENAEKVERPEPLPLRRESAPAQPYPVKALGKILAGAVNGIVDNVQCPDAIAAQSVLAAAALAAQAHADVVHPANGNKHPLSLSLITVAASGERKSAADRFALGPVGLREAELYDEYERELRKYHNSRALYDKEHDAIIRSKGDRAEKEKLLESLGAAPKAPMAPLLRTGDPTLEGLQKLLEIGQPSMGLFSDEGGTFIGGHSFQDEFRVRTGAGLSSLWDGAPITRVRGGDGWMVLRDRRLSLHLMVQPGIADMLLADPTLQSQGLLSRFLVSAPPSMVGTRMQKPIKATTAPALKKYQDAILKLLRKPQRRVEGKLDPRPISLSPEAVKKWVMFADECERDLGPGQRLEPVLAFANKLSEQALRMAGVLELVENPNATEVSLDSFERAVTLARYYAGEALRLFNQGLVPAKMQHAVLLLGWLHKQRGKPQICMGDILQNGPFSLREVALARPAMQLLADYHWVIPIQGGATIDRKRHREAWEIVPEQ